MNAFLLADKPCNNTARGAMLMDAIKSKYKRIEAACDIFGCGRKKMRKMALDAGALYKVEKVLLIDVEKIEEYIQKYFRVSADE